MPKPPPVEYFECICRMPVLTAGPIMAQLSKMEGLDVSAPHLVTEIKTFRQNAVNTHPQVSSRDYLLEWIKDHPTFRAKEAVAHFNADGRSKNSAYPVLSAAVEEGILKKLGPGEYSRADVKHLPAPKKAKKQVQVRRDVDHPTFLLRNASRNHGRFNTSWMKAQFEKDGRKAGNVSPTIAKLMKLKQIKRVGDSEYVLMSKATAPKKQAVKTNGAAV